MRNLLASWFEKYLGYENARAGRVLTALSIAFLIFIWFAGISWGLEKRTDFLRENSRVLDRHRAAMEMQIQGIFKPAEVFLRIADQWLLDHPNADPRTDPEFGRLVSGFQESTSNTALIRVVAARVSEILCVRHNMSARRSMYAKQDEQEETGSVAAQHSQRTD